MKAKTTIIAVMFLILLNTAFAITTYEETSSVSRIVGESTTEMLKQMQRQSIDLTHATYYSPSWFNNQKSSILQNQFGSNAQINTPLITYSFNDVKNSIANFKKNELFIIEANGQNNPLIATAGTILSKSILYPSSVKDWQIKFGETNPLIIFDSPYAGAYLPKQDSFVSRLARDSTIIAPGSFNSPQFVQSLLCQLADENTIGDVFKEARNFHYNGGSVSAGDNYIGLVLQSYALFGNPLQKINMQWTEYDRQRIKNTYCKNNLENLAAGIEFLGTFGNYSKFRKYVTFEIPSYNIQKAGNFSLINATNAFQNYEYGELVLPVAVRTTHFPRDTIITNYSLVSMTRPVELQVNNLPIYKEQFVKKCYKDKQEQSTLFTDEYTQTEHNFIARISPVKVINCTTGSVRMYRLFNYSIDYITTSPALVKNVNAPVEKRINELINVSVEIMPLSNKQVNGTLAIFDQDNKKLWEKGISNNAATYSSAFYAPPYEGLQQYSAEFMKNNVTLSYRSFNIFITILEPRANIPVTVGSNPTISIDFYSYLAQTFKLFGKYYLTNKTKTIGEGNFTISSVKQGSNLQQFLFSNLRREEQSYSLTIELYYLNQKRVISYLLTTNNVPLIYLPDNINAYENETVMLNTTVVDYDTSDILTISNNNPKFVKKGSVYVWKTKIGDKGNYTATITANDGLLENKKTVLIEILPYVAPVIPTIICGNSIRDGAEVCDGSDLTGQTCVSKGFSSGKLKCKSDCTGFDTSGCTIGGTVPATPSSLAITKVEPNLISLSWCPVSGATKYNLYMANSASGTYNKINTGNATGWTCNNGLMVSGLVSLTTYYFKVSSLNAAGESALSNYVSAKTTSTPVCGNKIKEGTEFCDGNSQSCTVNGYSGTKTCNSQCTGWNSCTTTAKCGDNVKSGNEVCDGDSISCDSGYTGNKICKSDCTGYDASSCMKTLYNCRPNSCPENFQDGGISCTQTECTRVCTYSRAQTCTYTGGSPVCIPAINQRVEQKCAKTETPCQKNIQCGEWSPQSCNALVVNGIYMLPQKQKRTCEDTNKCEDPTLYQEEKECPACQSDIVCDAWNPATCPVVINGIYINQQSTTCRDNNHCIADTTETRACNGCIPDWQCSAWNPSQCPLVINGIYINDQTRTCTDMRCNMGSRTESRTC